MKKIIIIFATRRKKNTFNLIEQISEILKNHDIEIEFINLYDYQIKYCIGCENCILKGNCILKDDVEEIMLKMKNCDGIILATPVYIESVSGILKSFFDRTCKWFHRPEIFGKPVLIISTTKGSGLKNTINYIKKVVYQWGCINAGSIGRTIITINIKIKDKECSKFIKLVLANQENRIPSVSDLFHFQIKRTLAITGGINLDYDYWKKKEWLDKSYFYDCKIKKIRKLLPQTFGNFFIWFLGKKKAKLQNSNI